MTGINGNAQKHWFQLAGETGASEIGALRWGNVRFLLQKLLHSTVMLVEYIEVCCLFSVWLWLKYLSFKSMWINIGKWVQVISTDQDTPLFRPFLLRCRLVLLCYYLRCRLKSGTTLRPNSIPRVWKLYLTLKLYIFFINTFFFYTQFFDYLRTFIKLINVSIWNKCNAECRAP